MTHLIGLIAAFSSVATAGLVYFAQVDVSASIENLVGGVTIVGAAIWITRTVSKELKERADRMQAELDRRTAYVTQLETELEEWRTKYEAEFKLRLALEARGITDRRHDPADPQRPDDPSQ